MEPFIINTPIKIAEIKLAEGIYYSLTDKSDYYPERLSGNMLALFQRFKSFYDSKDARKISCTISDSYSGSFYGAKRKPALLQFFKSNFDYLPGMVYPNLTINIHQILEKRDEIFSAILEFKNNLKVGFVPVAYFDSGEVKVEARPDGAYGTWRITSIDHIRDYH